MTLLFGSIMGFACGWALGRRAIAYVAVGLVWYAALAVQTSYWVTGSGPGGVTALSRGRRAETPPAPGPTQHPNEINPIVQARDRRVRHPIAQPKGIPCSSRL